jgi:hypothetical protein
MESVKAMMDALSPFLDMQHWEDCAARKGENEGDVDDNPGEYLADCECSIKPIHEIYDALAALVPVPTAPARDLLDVQFVREGLKPGATKEDIWQAQAAFERILAPSPLKEGEA